VLAVSWFHGFGSDFGVEKIEGEAAFLSVVERVNKEGAVVDAISAFDENVSSCKVLVVPDEGGFCSILSDRLSVLSGTARRRLPTTWGWWGGSNENRTSVVIFGFTYG
jgi:hypothetical protein